MSNTTLTVTRADYVAAVATYEGVERSAGLGQIAAMVILMGTMEGVAPSERVAALRTEMARPKPEGMSNDTFGTRATIAGNILANHARFPTLAHDMVALPPGEAVPAMVARICDAARAWWQYLADHTGADLADAFTREGDISQAGIAAWARGKAPSAKAPKDEVAETMKRLGKMTMGDRANVLNRLSALCAADKIAQRANRAADAALRESATDDAGTARLSALLSVMVS